MSKQRYVIMRGQVFRWEEKAPFGQSGKSVPGALEYEPDSDTVKCHECGQWFRWISPTHLNFVHRMNAREYRQRHNIRVRTGLCTPSYSKRVSEHTKKLRSDGTIGPGFPSLKREYGHRTPPNWEERRNEQLACKVQTLAIIQHTAGELGYTPSLGEIGEKVGKRAAKHFGSWSAACVAAGLEPNRSLRDGPRFPDGVLLELVLDFYVLNKRLPRTKDFGCGRLPSISCYERRFKSLENTFAKCGLGKVCEMEGGAKRGPKQVARPVREAEACVA